MSGAAYLFLNIMFFVIHNYTTVLGIKYVCYQFPGENRNLSLHHDLMKVVKTGLLVIPSAYFASIFINMFAGVLAYALIFIFFIKRRFNFLTLIDIAIILLINSVTWIGWVKLAGYTIPFTIGVFIATIAGFYHASKIIKGDNKEDEERAFIESQKIKFLKEVENDPMFRTWCYECVNFNGKYCVEGHDCDKKEISMRVNEREQQYCLYWIKCEEKKEESCEEESNS